VEVQTKYETEKKELQIASLSKDKELNDTKLKEQRTLIYSVSAGLVLLLSLCFFIFRGYREKKKANAELEEKNGMIEEKNKDITDSINYAKRIQRAILTSESYLKKHLPEHFVLNKPKDIVSGDFYWSYETPDKKMIVVVADCTGHGVPGAFMSLIGASKLNEIVIERKITNPDRILNQLREEVINAMNPEDADEISMDGMDVSICCFEPEQMKMQYAGANNPVYLVRAEDLIVLKPDKFPVGKYSGDIMPFTNNSISVSKGDVVYLFSDGYADQFGGVDGKKFKYKHLQNLLKSLYSVSMEEQKKILDLTIEQWKGKMEQVDDILIIGIRL
jgi:serine phosphatase RsbU (regulator of sigma subunit)